MKQIRDNLIRQALQEKTIPRDLKETKDKLIDYILDFYNEVKEALQRTTKENS